MACDGPTTRVKAQTTAFSFCSNNNNTVSTFSLYFSFYFSFHFIHSSFFNFKERTQHKFLIKNQQQQEEKTQLQQVNPIHMEVFFLFFLPKCFLDILLVNSFVFLVFTPHDFILFFAFIFLQFSLREKKKFIYA